MKNPLVKITLFTGILALALHGRLAAQLYWGESGGGGSGTWDLSSANWWDGSGMVAWAANDDAVFEGTGGTVTAVYPGPAVNSLTFNSPGYSITGGWINTSSASGLIVTTNADATIGSTLSSNGSSVLSQLTKNGAGTLTITGTNFLGAVQVNEGEYRLAGSGDLFFSNVVLADAAGVTVTLGQTSDSVSVMGLSGGGATGGVIRPDDQARTVTLTLFEGTSSPVFSGVLADNGAGVLAIDAFGATGESQILAGVNTYSGATSVTGVATLVFAGNGSALNSSSVSVGKGAVLRLDNSGTVVEDRLADSVPVTLAGGTLQLVGNVASAVTESLGALSIQGNATVDVSRPSTPAADLSFSGLNRIGRGTLNVTGTGGVKIPGVANVNGIAPVYIVSGNDWATVNANGELTALTSYATDLHAAQSTDNVLITASGSSASLEGSSSWNSLNVKNPGADGFTLDVGAGHVLTLNSGGLLSSGTAASSITGGTVQAGDTDELVIMNRNTLTVSSVVADGPVATGLTKSGEGTLTLEGDNTYTGDTAVNDGVLSVGADANLGRGANVVITQGTVRITSDFTSAKVFGSTSGTSGTIDTNGHHLTLSSASSGSLHKTGDGTLTLTAGSGGALSVDQGTLELLGNDSYSTVSLASPDATLVAGTTINSFQLLNGGHLDIGGAAAATLVTQHVSSLGNFGILTVTFGLGDEQSDLWQISSHFVGAAPSAQKLILFDFDDLGGLETGHAYTLIEFLGSASVTASYFGLAEDMTDSGWAGDFALAGNTLTVTFSAIPEPAVLALCLGCVALLVAVRRPRRSRPTSGRS